MNASFWASGLQASSRSAPPDGAMSCFTWPAEPITLTPLALAPLATAIAS